MALILSLLNADNLQTSLRRWSIADIHGCSSDGSVGLPQHTKAILHTLASHGATPTSVRGFSIDDVKALQAADMDTLVDRGLASAQNGGLRLTAVTTKALRADMVLLSPAEVPAVRPGVVLLNMTILELLLSMEAAGRRPQWLRGKVVELPPYGWRRQDLVCSDRCVQNGIR